MHSFPVKYGHGRGKQPLDTWPIVRSTPGRGKYFEHRQAQSFGDLSVRTRPHWQQVPASPAPWLALVGRTPRPASIHHQRRFPLTIVRELPEGCYLLFSYHRRMYVLCVCELTCFSLSLSVHL